MSTAELAAALQRVESVLQRRPQAGLHDDAPATAQWQGGARVVTQHAGGAQVVTDLPVELGGQGLSFPPGWLLRAALSSCAATRIVMAASREGVDLVSLQVLAQSSSDTRGLLDMLDAEGQLVPAGPKDVKLSVRIHARGISAEALHALVQRSTGGSPVACALAAPVTVALQIEAQVD